MPDAQTALGGPGTGWDPHQLRNSALTHLGEGGVSLLMLVAKSRHKKTENLCRYFHPTPESQGLPVCLALASWANALA
ncbi:hypothetical protein ACQP1W_31315 [Spirillospora sp. CA-255316]